MVSCAIHWGCKIYYYLLNIIVLLIPDLEKKSKVVLLQWCAIIFLHHWSEFFLAFSLFASVKIWKRSHLCHECSFLYWWYVKLGINSCTFMYIHHWRQYKQCWVDQLGWTLPVMSLFFSITGQSSSLLVVPFQWDFLAFSCFLPHLLYMLFKSNWPRWTLPVMKYSITSLVRVLLCLFLLPLLFLACCAFWVDERGMHIVDLFPSYFLPALPARPTLQLA